MKPLATNIFRLMQPSQRILARLRAKGVDTSSKAAVEAALREEKAGG
jgi:hypothetical protein